MELTIKQWMAIKEETNASLAEKSGISEATISHVRTGKTKPNLDTLLKIAEALEIKINDIKF